MQKIKTFLERLYERRNSQEFDSVLLVLGDEGVGKSTLMLQLMACWNEIRGRDPSVDEMLDNIAWEREDLRSAMADFESRQVIMTPDAARALMKQDAVKPAQKEVKKAFLDIRTKEFLILLGYQGWGDVPSFLQKRRAHAVLRIPSRGRVEGYSRSSVDYKLRECRDEEWPNADLKDSFPKLDGTEIWEEYRKRDVERKEGSVDPFEDDDSGDGDGDEKLMAEEIVEEIDAESLPKYISQNPANKVHYIDSSLIHAHFKTSGRQAEIAQKLLRQQFDIEDVIAEA